MSPHQMNRARWLRASTAARRDQRSSPWRVLSRRGGSGRRSTGDGRVPSTSAASGWNPVETTMPGGG